MLQNIFSGFVNMIYDLVRILDLTSPIRVLILIADLIIVMFIIYYFYKIIKTTRAGQIFKGILLIFFLFLIAKVFNMVILNFILINFLINHIFHKRESLQLCK